MIEIEDDEAGEVINQVCISKTQANASLKNMKFENEVGNGEVRGEEKVGNKGG